MLKVSVYSHPGHGIQVQMESPGPLHRQRLLMVQVCVEENAGNICQFSIILLEYRSPLVAKTVAGRCP